MATFIATLAFESLLEAILVGVTFFAIAGSASSFANSRKGLLALLCIFVVLSVYYLPAIYALNISVKVGNVEMAEAFDMRNGFTSVSDLLSFGWLDVVVCLGQTAIAYYVGRHVIERATKRTVGNPSMEE